jgi:transposase
VNTDDPLPDDLAAAHAMILAERAARLAAEAQVSGARLEIERLRLLLAKARREQFGQTSERGKRLIDQLELQLSELEETAAEAETAAEITAPSIGRSARPSGARKPARRRPLPEHLPRERIVYPAPCQCPRCGGPVRKLGEDVTETLECVPRRWKVVEHVREKVSCRRCEAISQPPAPSHPIARGRAGPHLLALVLAAKYGQHLPLTRQSTIYAREGVAIEVSTLADWVGAAAASLMPLVEAIRGHVFAAERVHADDTTVPVLAKEKTKVGRLWAYVRDDRPFAGPAPPAVAFFYSPDRGGEHPERHLASFSGIMQADAYAGFNRLYEPNRQPGPILEAACWAHLWMPLPMQGSSRRSERDPRLRSSIRPVVATRPAPPALMVIRELAPNHVPRAQGSMRPAGCASSGSPGVAITRENALAPASARHRADFDGWP